MNFNHPYGGHLGLAVGGFFSFLPACIRLELPPLQALGVPLLVFIGALFPDLDTHSTPSKWAARIGVIASLGLLWFNLPFYAAIIGILFMLTKCGKHRGWTHSILLVLAIIVASIHFQILPFGAAFSFGLLIHILSDDIYSRLKKSKHV